MLILNENDTVLDLGCGEWSITVPLSKKVKKVIALDSSVKMLECLEKRVNTQNISNIECILKPIEEIKYDEIRRQHEPYHSDSSDSDDNSDGDMLVVSVFAGCAKTNVEWILDMACTFHMCPNRNWFTTE